MLFLGIALGSMALMMIQHLSGGTWGVFRRIFEASSRTLPLLMVLFLPVLFGMRSLYPWTHAALVQRRRSAASQGARTLNTPFFIARAAVYFAGWWGISSLLNKWSRLQDTGDVAVNTRIQRLSGAGLVFYALAVTFAGIDWIMSLNPHWYSTHVRVPDDGRAGPRGARLHHRGRRPSCFATSRCQGCSSRITSTISGS